MIKIPTKIKLIVDFTLWFSLLERYELRHLYISSNGILYPISNWKIYSESILDNKAYIEAWCLLDSGLKRETMTLSFGPHKRAIGSAAVMELKDEVKSLREWENEIAPSLKELQTFENKNEP